MSAPKPKDEPPTNPEPDGGDEGKGGLLSVRKSLGVEAEPTLVASRTFERDGVAWEVRSLGAVRAARTGAGLILHQIEFRAPDRTSRVSLVAVMDPEDLSEAHLERAFANAAPPREDPPGGRPRRRR